MAQALKNRPEFMVKLAATSMGLTIAAAKLISYNRSIVSELEKDAEYIKSLEKAYVLAADHERDFANKFMAVSAEVDKLMLGSR